MRYVSGLSTYMDYVYIGIHLVLAYKKRLISTISNILTASAGVTQDAFDKFGNWGGIHI